MQNSRIQNIQKKISVRGFTLVEMIVAVGILISATVGPIFLAAQGIGVANEAKNRILAVYLADEVLEAIKNQRDTNIARGFDWRDGFSTCTGSVRCKLDVWSNVITPCAGDDCLIRTVVGDNPSELQYGHTGTLTNFNLRRDFYYEEGTSPNEIKLIVRVEWREKLTNKRVEIINYLYKWN